MTTSGLTQLVDLIVQLASGDLSARLEPSEAGDSLDAVITGINLLAEELDLIYRTMEDRVAERTFALNQARIALERMALYDALTGLANRTLLGDRIRQATARAERGARPPCVLVLDLDEFKTINDGLGHGAGDRILIEVARRLTSVVRETDTVARLGGDEFAILMPDTTEDDALRVAERALKELQQPVHRGRSGGLGRRQHRPVFRVAGADRRQSAAGRRHRDVRGKSQRPRNIQIFRPEMHHAARERLQIASEFGDGDRPRRVESVLPADRRAGFRPHHRRRSAGPLGASGARGLLLPADFIPVAEDSGHIIELGHWVVQAAIGQLRSWSRHSRTPFQLHVNLSPVEVRWPGMAEFIRDALEEQGSIPTGWPWRSPKPD